MRDRRAIPHILAGSGPIPHISIPHSSEPVRVITGTDGIIALNPAYIARIGSNPAYPIPHISEGTRKL